MKYEFSKTFYKSLRKLNNHQLNKDVADVVKAIELANAVEDIPSIKKLKGYKEYYRIRIGDYRIGAKLEKDNTLWLAVIDNRKDIYKYFP